MAETMTKEQAAQVFIEITGAAPTNDLAGAVRARIFRVALVRAFDSKDAFNKSINALRDEAVQLPDENVERLKEIAEMLDVFSAEKAVAEEKYAMLRSVWDVLGLSLLRL